MGGMGLRSPAFCPGRPSGFAASANGVPWDGLARTISVAFWGLVLFAIVNSALANANTSVLTRTAYAFGRIGVFPRVRRAVA